MNEIIIKSLSKSYDGKTVFNNLNINIPLEGITLLTGESGKGKTTLLRIIAGLETADSGEISNTPEKISFMFQEDRLIEWLSAEDNISIVSDKEKADKYLKEVELYNDKDKIAKELSGGMKRRVALARALAFDSNLVILDEAFKGMDTTLKQKMMDLVIKESKKRPFIIVVHEPEEASYLSKKIIKI